MALALALVVVIAAVAVIAAKGPFASGSADLGDNGSNDNDQTGDNTNDGDSNGNDQSAPAVTTITASKTAEGFWDVADVYTWSVEKEVYENERVLLSENEDGYGVEIERGECAVISYNVSAEVEGPCEESTYGVMGEITVTNTGCNATEQLVIWDIVQVKTGGCEFIDLVKVQIDTSAKPVLAAGESFSYSYKIAFEPVEGACYRNLAQVTICNFVDHSGVAFGVEACDTFSLPCEPTSVEDFDDDACLEDIFVVPEGFTVEALTEVGPWELECGEETSEWEFCVNLKVTNVNATGDMCFILCNQAVLVPEDSMEGIVAHAPISIYTGAIETTLAVEKTAETSWSEDVELGVDLPDGFPVSEVIVGDDEIAPEILPVDMSQYVIRDDGIVNVCGYITVTNTGMYATEGLAVTDTVRMMVDDCWVDLATVCVDVSCMPVLQPGECFSYPYAVTFCIENITLALNGADICNVAYAEICNYDAEEGVSGVYVYLPLEFPLNPTVMTMETNVVCSFEEIAPLPHTGMDSQITFQTDVCYHQMVIVRFCEDMTTVDTWTNVTAHTVVTHSCWHEEVCEDLETAIYHAESAVIRGDDRVAEIAFESTTYDNDAMTICILCYPVELNMCSVLYADNYLCVDLNENMYVFQNMQTMFYGAFVSFEIPEEACQEEVA